MKRLALLFTISIISCLTSFAQSDTCHLRISLLTCSPGSELYSTFGHTAIRVTDAQATTDFVFNYGTFEFAPDFYTKFIRGKLLYSLSVQYFSDFVNDYNFEKRSIIEQELNLTCAEKQKLYDALQVNALEENRHYRYDFLFDNCSTRPAVIIAKNTNAPVILSDILPRDKPTFRNLIHSYLNRGNQYWSKFGIDILLGSKLDKKVTTQQATFLPDYLMLAFDSASLRNQPLVSSKQTILKQPDQLNKKSAFRPEIVFSILLVIIALLTFVKNKNAKQFLRIFDFVFFLTLGLASLIILFMWFGTDHIVTQNNLNLLWALPTHLLVVFALHKNKVWHQTYFKTIFVISCLFLLSWFILPQQLNFTVLPVLLIIILRSWFIGFKKNKMKEFIYQNKKIYYRIKGKGKPVVLLHGFGEDGDIWQNQFDALSDFQLIIPDLPGSGKSEMIDDMSMNGIAECMYHLLINEHISDCVMIGHSMGGYITMAFVETYQNMLSAFGLFHSTAYADTPEKIETREKGIQFINDHGAFPFLKTSIPNLYSDITKKEAPQLIEAHIQSVNNFSNAALIAYYRSMINRPDRSNLLQQNTLPVLFVLGKYDVAVPLQDGLKQCYLPYLSYIHILENSGHMGMIEEAESSNQILLNFLQVKATVTK